MVSIIEKNKKIPYKYLFDIAANLCDEKFQGIYHGKKVHSSDIDSVLQRAKEYNVNKLLLSVSNKL